MYYKVVPIGRIKIIGERRTTPKIVRVKISEICIYYNITVKTMFFQYTNLLIKPRFNHPFLA